MPLLIRASASSAFCVPNDLFQRQRFSFLLHHTPCLPTLPPLMLPSFFVRNSSQRQKLSGEFCCPKAYCCNVISPSFSFGKRRTNSSRNRRRSSGIILGLSASQPVSLPFQSPLSFTAAPLCPEIPASAARQPLPAPATNRDLGGCLPS